MQVSVYRVKVRFEQLFADPVIFEDPPKLVQRYLALAGTPSEQLGYIQQTTGEIVPVDDSGKPSVVSGTAKYSLGGKKVRSEFMAGANLLTEYADFGSELSPEDHRLTWEKGRWKEMRFEVKSFSHEIVAIEMADPEELYTMLHERADPTTIATVELTNTPETLFSPTAHYLEERLKRLPEKGSDTVEVYAARNLTSEERQALEKRITREATPLTLYVILSRNPPN